MFAQIQGKTLQSINSPNKLIFTKITFLRKNIDFVIFKKVRLETSVEYMRTFLPCSVVRKNWSCYLWRKRKLFYPLRSPRDSSCLTLNPAEKLNQLFSSFRREWTIYGSEPSLRVDVPCLPTWQSVLSVEIFISGTLTQVWISSSSAVLLYGFKLSAHI